jgi:hypothetical protein
MDALDISTFTEETYIESKAWVLGNCDVNVHVTPGFMVSIFTTSRGPNSYAQLRRQLSATRGIDLRVITLPPIELRNLIVELIRGGLTREYIDAGVYSILEYDRLV